MQKETTNANQIPRDMELTRQHFELFVSCPDKLPVSYVYGGDKYKGLPKYSVMSRRFVDANIVETVMTGFIGDLQIKAECLSYRDYPVVEWTIYFSCLGNKNTKILRDVLAIDACIKGENAVLIHSNGDFYSKDGYTESKTELKDGTKFTQAPNGGRPCDGAFPYQRVLFDGFGVNISIGWPGQWSCEYSGGKDGVSLKAGQEISHTYIKPGEIFRTPRMTLMIFDGDETRGINIWRRWFNAHVTPRQKGRILEPKSVLCDNNGGVEWQEATEENQLASIAYAKEHFPGARLWWIDAGWYPCRDANGNKTWPVTGDWIPDPERFPNGFAPIGKACKDAGMELLVWHEPERVHKDSKLCKERPEWMLAKKTEENWSYLLDLTNPECHKWLCEHMASHIKESEITCYRQDFNFEPLKHWRDNESTDRQGMVENLYIQGYLSYWDYLLMNIPDLWIDSCASGGRRNDLETMRRSVPLHPTDYGYGYHHVNQAFRHMLHSWIPFTRGWTNSWDKDNEYYNHEDYYAPEPPSLDNFKLINGFGCLTFFAGVSDLKALGGELPYGRKLLGIWEKCAEMQLTGDFYALTENHRDNKKWTAFQFDCPESETGAIQVLRNNQAKDETLTVFPKGFCGSCEYIFTNEETDETFELCGGEINKNGITFAQPVRSGAIWFYRMYTK
ncbi:MAG: alpha-galactosidase [Oscillospiraceae bacterium]|nr:alpha-galactosidase [Oscillospiraceae bacterium]